MTSQPRARDSEPYPSEELEEMTEQTARTMADARKQVDRARQTLHDQLLPASQSIEETEPEDGQAARDEDGQAAPDEDGGRGGRPT